MITVSFVHEHMQQRTREQEQIRQVLKHAGEVCPVFQNQEIAGNNQESNEYPLVLCENPSFG